MHYSTRIWRLLKLLTVTCTIPPISDKSRFACAHVWSVCVITRSLLVAFTRGCFAFISICREIRKKQKKKGTKYQLKSFLVSIRESYELSNSQKPKFIWSFLFLVVLRWDLSIKVLLLSYPCCYYIKHTTCIWTALILPWKGVERKYTDDWAKKTMHTIKYNKKFSFGKIQHNIQWDKFTPLSATKGQLSYQHWKSEKKSPIYIISSVDQDLYPFHNFLPRIQEDTSIDIPWV